MKRRCKYTVLIITVLFMSSCHRHFHIYTNDKPSETKQDIPVEKYDGMIYYIIKENGIPEINLVNDTLKLNDVQTLLLFQRFIDDILVFPEENENVSPLKIIRL